MLRLAGIATIAALLSAPAMAQTQQTQQTQFPDLRGTWKGNSESIVSGAGNPHHPGSPQSGIRLRSVPFTLTIDKQDGRRVSGTFSSARLTESFIAVLTANNSLLLVDDKGYGVGTLLPSNRLELCYLQRAAHGRVASCTEFTRQS